jgi:hypothetical protein
MNYPEANIVFFSQERAFMALRFQIISPGAAKKCKFDV